MDPQSDGNGGGGPTVREAHKALQQRKRLTQRIGWLAFLAFFAFSVLQLGIAPDRLIRMAERLSFILGTMLPPVFDEPTDLFSAAIESVQVAVIGTAFGILFSLVLGIFAAKNVTPIGPLSWLIKGFAGFVRAVPALVWALLFIMAVGFGATAGILALSVNSIGMLVKVYAETIEEIDMGPVEALRASGASHVQVFSQAIMPSISAIFIAWSIFRFDINIRYASVLGIVGAGGIGLQLLRAAQQSRYDEAMGVTLVIFAMVLLAELASDWLQRRIDASSARSTELVAA